MEQFDTTSRKPLTFKVKSEWQSVANDYPIGTTLFLVPGGDSPVSRSMLQVMKLVRSRGQEVAICDCQHFLKGDAALGQIRKL